VNIQVNFSLFESTLVSSMLFHIFIWNRKQISLVSVWKVSMQAFRWYRKICNCTDMERVCLGNRMDRLHTKCYLWYEYITTNLLVYTMFFIKVKIAWLEPQFLFFKRYNKPTQFIRVGWVIQIYHCCVYCLYICLNLGLTQITYWMLHALFKICKIPILIRYIPDEIWLKGAPYSNNDPFSISRLIYPCMDSNSYIRANEWEETENRNFFSPWNVNLLDQQLKVHSFTVSKVPVHLENFCFITLYLVYMNLKDIWPSMESRYA